MDTIVLHLLACDPLPPCAAKLKVWFQRPSMANVPERAPTRVDVDAL